MKAATADNKTTSYNYEFIYHNTQWVYKSTDPVINVKFADNHTLDIARASTSSTSRNS